MSLIECPECGKEISSNAKLCPNCGCEITVCPDCNSVYAGKPEICKTCGYIFEKQSQDNEPEPDFFTAYSKAFKVFDIVMGVIGILGLALVCAAYIDYEIVWERKEPLLKLANLSDTIITVQALVVSGIIIYNISNIITPLSYGLDWLQIIILKRALNYRHIDGKDYCKTFLENKKNRTKKHDCFLLLFASYYQKNRKDEIKLYIFTIISAILRIVSAVYLVIFLVNQIEMYFTYDLLGISVLKSEIWKTFTPYIQLSIIAVSAITNFIIRRYFLRSNMTRIETWFKDNYSLPFDFNIKHARRRW